MAKGLAEVLQPYSKNLSGDGTAWSLRGFEPEAVVKHEVADISVVQRAAL